MLPSASAFQVLSSGVFLENKKCSFFSESVLMNPLTVENHIPLTQTPGRMRMSLHES